MMYVQRICCTYTYINACVCCMCFAYMHICTGCITDGGRCSLHHGSSGLPHRIGLVRLHWQLVRCGRRRRVLAPPSPLRFGRLTLLRGMLPAPPPRVCSAPLRCVLQVPPQPSVLFLSPRGACALRSRIARERLLRGSLSKRRGW
jgi:hypothetical protein